MSRKLQIRDGENDGGHGRDTGRGMEGIGGKDPGGLAMDKIGRERTWRTEMDKEVSQKLSLIKQRNGLGKLTLGWGNDVGPNVTIGKCSNYRPVLGRDGG